MSRLNIFLKELLLFGATIALGLYAAYRYVSLHSDSLFIQTPTFSYSDLWSIVFVALFLILATKFKRAGQFFFRAFLLLLIFSGSHVLSSLFFGWPFDTLAALAVMALFLWWRLVLIHNLAIIITLAGIGALLGISIAPMVGVVILVALSFYDIIAVYKTKHMIRMAENMIASGAIFGFIIPQNFRSFLAHRKAAQAKIGDQFMILGSGDIGLPVIFASSLMRQSLAQAVVVGVFAVLGLLVTHILFVSQKKRQPMAALPPIATACLIGYVVALLIIK